MVSRSADSCLRRFTEEYCNAWTLRKLYSGRKNTSFASVAVVLHADDRNGKERFPVQCIASSQFGLLRQSLQKRHENLPFGVRRRNLLKQDLEKNGRFRHTALVPKRRNSSFAANILSLPPLTRGVISSPRITNQACRSAHHLFISSLLIISIRHSCRRTYASKRNSASLYYREGSKRA